MPRLFLHDPVAGETLDYSALASAVLGGMLGYRSCCQPSRLSEAFFGFAVALAADRDLTLVDDRLTERELAALGLEAGVLQRAEQVTNPRQARDFEGWLDDVRASCRSRITLFTSGSTGLPKGVSHHLATLSRGVRVAPKHASDVWGFAYNPTHMAGVQVLLQAIFNLNPLVNLFRLPRETVLQLLEEYGVTHLSATPSFYRLLMPAKMALPAVRAVTLGGERVETVLLDRLRGLFPNARLRNIYASTEAGSLFSAEGEVFSVPDALTGRIEIRDGRLHLHRELLGEFTGPGGASVSASQSRTGDAEARQQPRPTDQEPVEKSLAWPRGREGTLSQQKGERQGERGLAGSDAWYDTGDVVELVSEAPLRFRIVGRDRDWINVGGNKVNPTEVEAVLLEHPGLREARVYGRKNTVLGSVLCAEVVPVGPPPDESDLRQFVATRLQGFKVPRLIRSVPALEVSRTGKLKR